MRRLLPLTTALLLAAPVVADAATIQVVRGRGWGHGVGLSQYGAYGYAQHGYGYREILAHYYLGTQLTRTTAGSVRVLLQASDPRVRFSGASRAGPTRVRPGSTYVVRRAPAARLALYSARGRLLGRYDPPLEVSRRGHPVLLLGRALNGVRSGFYRGSLLLMPGLRGGVTAVNAVALEPYLQGVVPGEMPSGWHPEALKAQAVAARSYALATSNPYGVFDLYPDTRSQVYRGVSGEAASTNAAVRDTAGEVLTSGGTPVVAYFFSTSGGHTENVENVFSSALHLSYLRGVPDPFDDIAPRHRWRLTFTNARMERKLRRYVRGRFQKIVVLARGVSPRIVLARVVGTRGTSDISGFTLRSRLGIYDSWAYFTRVSTSQARGRPSIATFLRGRAPARRLGLAGAFEPAPRGRRLLVERRLGARWRAVRRIRTDRRGRYRVGLRSVGVYRVRAGSIAGPAVRVR